MGNLTRKIERNVLKNEQNSNKINTEWKKYMSYKYSYGKILELEKKNKRGRKNEK